MSESSVSLSNSYVSGYYVILATLANTLCEDDRYGQIHLDLLGLAAFFDRNDVEEFVKGGADRFSLRYLSSRKKSQQEYARPGETKVRLTPMENKKRANLSPIVIQTVGLMSGPTGSSQETLDGSLYVNFTPKDSSFGYQVFVSLSEIEGVDPTASQPLRLKNTTPIGVEEQFSYVYHPALLSAAYRNSKGEICDRFHVLIIPCEDKIYNKLGESNLRRLGVIIEGGKSYGPLLKLGVSVVGRGFIAATYNDYSDKQAGVSRYEPHDDGQQLITLAKLLARQDAYLQIALDLAHLEAEEVFHFSKVRRFSRGQASKSSFSNMPDISSTGRFIWGPEMPGGILTVIDAKHGCSVSFIDILVESLQDLDDSNQKAVISLMEDQRDKLATLSKSYGAIAKVYKK